MEKFRNLKVWQKAHTLVLNIYRITASFPSAERFGLTSQIRRAAVSVPANIAEGSRRWTKKDQAHFYTMANGSLEEVKYYLILGHDLKYLDYNDGKAVMNSAREVGKMLSGLNRFLK